MDSVSIDRIDPKGGYLKSNCRFILFGLNCLKGAYSDAQVLRVCRAVINKEEGEGNIDMQLKRVKDELITATARYGPFLTAHHGYAVILEELEEAWQEIKNKNLRNARTELIQTAAMCVRFILDTNTMRAA